MDNEDNNTPHRKFKHLSLEIRQIIKRMLTQGYSVSEIAACIGVHRSTVYREIKRGQRDKANKNASSYNPKRAQQRADKLKKEHLHELKSKHCRVFLDYSAKHFCEDGWSFDVSFHRALIDGFDRNEMVSVKTLYNYVDRDPSILQIKNIDLSEKMRRSPKKRKRLKKPSRLGTSIDLRPEPVNNRQEFGHWEIDTVIGKQGKGKRVIMTLVERLSRFYITVLIDGKTSDYVNKAFKALCRQFGSSIFRSITADNGAEFSKLAELENRDRKIYFAHPYSSYERGSNERHNGMLRRKIPKGVDMNTLSKAYVTKVQDKMNNTPRRILNYKTSKEVFEQFAAVKPQFHAELLEKLFPTLTGSVCAAESFPS